MNDFYKNCAFPKPQNKKKKKKVNGFRDKPNRYCFYTGKPYAERHEVFYGRGLRQISIDNGFQVDLCPELHREVHKKTERGNAINAYWQKFYQKKYMDKLVEAGITNEQALDMWMNLIGRNYL